MLSHIDRNKILKLPTPSINKDNVVGFNTGLRPYRLGGMRIELETIQTKNIIHNYGHGGGGVSLFFGSCKQAIEGFEDFIAQKNIKPNNITVIGAG